MKRPESITNKWFFSATPWYVKVTTLIFIKGDAIFIVPILVGILSSYLFISTSIGLLFTGTYILLRYLGEMMYWIMKQGSDRAYRPPDLGFKNLDNHALYILYQTFALLGMMVGIGIMLLAVVYL